MREKDRALSISRLSTSGSTKWTYIHWSSALGFPRPITLFELAFDWSYYSLPISYLNQWEGLGHEQQPFLFYFVCFSLCNPYCIGHFRITITVFSVHSVSTSDDQTDHDRVMTMISERERESVCVCLCVLFCFCAFLVWLLYSTIATQLYLIGSC